MTKLQDDLSVATEPCFNAIENYDFRVLPVWAQICNYFSEISSQIHRNLTYNY